jgi:hypothetical protein
MRHDSATVQAEKRIASAMGNQKKTTLSIEARSHLAQVFCSIPF